MIQATILEEMGISTVCRVVYVHLLRFPGVGMSLQILSDEFRYLNIASLIVTVQRLFVSLEMAYPKAAGPPVRLGIREVIYAL